LSFGTGESLFGGSVTMIVRARLRRRRHERPSARDAAEVRVLADAAHELGQRLAAVRRRARARHEQADGAVASELAQLPARHVVEDDDAEGRRSGNRLRRRGCRGDYPGERDEAEKE